MRVLHLSHCYPPAVGGSETVMRELSLRLVQQHGHEVTVVTTTGYNTAAFRVPGQPTMRPGEELRDGVVVRRHHADPRLSPRLDRPQRLAFRWRVPGNGMLRTLYDGPLAPGMLRDAASLPADVIGATAFPLLHMQFAVAAARARRIPVALLGALHPEDSWGYDRALIRVAMRGADAYIAYTEHERDYAEYEGVDPARVVVIPPGVDAARYENVSGSALRAELGIPDGDPVVGFVGQLGGHKGVDDLVAAMRRVWTAHRDAWLLIAGARTDFLERIHEAVAALRPSRARRVRFLLDFPQERKPEVLAALDVFASPSGYESFGLTFVEAWAAGRPVVGCRSGAIPAVVAHGEDGLLVGYRSQHELAGALIELLDDDRFRRRLAEAGRAKARDLYSWDRSARALSELYERLQGDGARPVRRVARAGA